ncbi:MAG: hypothetical protein RLZZ502_1793, partial [Pseudomonadota bacterium]
AQEKIKKQNAALTIELTPTVDILASVSATSNPPFCVGFAAESTDVIHYAKAKRVKKNVPLMVANKAQTAFGKDDNEVVLIDDVGEHPLPKADKLSVARGIVAHVAKMMSPVN